MAMNEMVQPCKGDGGGVSDSVLSCTFASCFAFLGSI